MLQEEVSLPNQRASRHLVRTRSRFGERLLQAAVTVPQRVLPYIHDVPLHDPLAAPRPKLDPMTRDRRRRSRAAIRIGKGLCR
jgi:hypothetical protein